MGDEDVLRQLADAVDAVIGGWESSLDIAGCTKGAIIPVGPVTEVENTMQYDVMKQAEAALRNAQTRAGRHEREGNLEKANHALHRGIRTALSWLDGSHPKLRSEGENAA